MKLTLGQVADWIHADGEFDTSAEAVGYGIDSRTIGAGELFFAVRGERLDGHDYVQTALANGAIAAVVSNRWVVPSEVDEGCLLRVAECDDCVLRALQQLAHTVRNNWGGRVIGKDYDERGRRAGSGGAIQRTEVCGKFEQWFWIATAANEIGAGT